MPRVVRFYATGGPEVLRIDQVEMPEPKAGDVRIAVGAIGLNRVDSLFRSGAMGPANLPSTIGNEAAGVIEALGADVKGFNIGDRVSLLPGLSMEEYGACADTIFYPADMLIRQPTNLSVEQSAAAWMQYLTAYAMVGIADIQPQQTVVITAASSSVGMAAIEIANLVGAIPIAITRGRAKAAALRNHGARHVIISDEENMAQAITRLTDGRGARLIFDAVAGETLPALVEAAMIGGWIVIYGALAGIIGPLPLPQTMMKGLTIRGYAMNVFMADEHNRHRALQFVSNGLANGKLKPVIDRIFKLEEIVEAYRYLESNAQIGKIIVRVR
jgi:NADPH2:quinone reductase